MPGRSDPRVTFHQTTVLVRADIFEKAREKEIDISNTCNQALATLLGIDYRQLRLDDVPVTPPVIVAADGAAPAAAPAQKKTGPVIRPPVINADDPAAAGVIARSRRPAPKKPVPASPETVPEPKPLPVKTRKPPAGIRAEKAVPEHGASKPKKAKQGDGLKAFIADKLVREETAGAHLPKEELFQIFSRWCREKKLPVPDAKATAVALKTKFAFREETIRGSPCWTHIRLK